MRQTYWDLSEGIVKLFESFSLEKSDIAVLISMELFITGCHQIDRNLSIQDAWSILVGYNEPVLKAMAPKDTVNRLRILFPELRHKRTLHKRLRAYSTINEQYRLYHLTEEGKATRCEPRFMKERTIKYEELLSQPISRRFNTMEFPSESNLKYSRKIRGGKSQSYSFRIPEPLLDCVPVPLPVYREKKALQLSLPYNAVDIGREMDIRLHRESSMWERRAQTVTLQPLNRREEKLNYKGNVHIGGGLASGKSTFMMLEAYRLVKQENATVGFIEGSVPQVLKRVQELRNLGIYAVPVIGRSSRRHHQQNYLLANSEKILEVSDWGNSEYSSLEHLSDVCMIKSFAKDYEPIADYPCLRLEQDSSLRKCPLAGMCGIYRDLADLNKAEVWVTTTASVLKTHIPAMLDPLERTIYEAMYDLLDVIFVDEADQVQQQFDEAFLTEYNVFGSPDDIFEKLRRESYELTSGNYGQYAGDSIINEWNDRLRMLDLMVWRIYTKLEKSQTLRRKIRNELIRVAALASEISDKLATTDTTQRQIFNMLTAYALDPYKDPLLSELANQLIETEDHADKEALLNELIQKVGGQMKPRIKKELLYAQLEFFLYLSRAEESIKYVLTAFPMVQAKLGLRIDFSPLFTMQKDFQPFMKEAMTGITLGYKYDLPDGAKTGKFKLIEYTAVGRLLLHEWNHLYRDSDNKEGPSVVFLSGTSHAPGSAHFDLFTPTNWLLQADRKRSNIDIFYKPVLDMNRGEFYSISGEQDQERKREALNGMVRHIKQDIEYELQYWRTKGAARKILLVVNSYDDVETVGAAFQNDSRWTERYKLLSRQGDLNEDQVSRVLIESFKDETAEVLIVPMLSVGRGYNILGEDGTALFGSVFFLVRPYPIPHDLNYLVQMLHASLPEYLNRIRIQGLHYDKAMNNLRHKSSWRLEQMYLKPDYWSLLSDQDRIIMGWYTFVPTWQMIGRLLRGGLDARVFFCDSKFAAEPTGNSEGLSMLGVWQFIMHDHQEDSLFQSLYGSFIDAINRLDLGGEIE
ncbi:hypothetical protein J7E78_20055 [Paenibacillus polymyxa]|uniref:pPIWI_RE_Z domain-containing protein n=1 Tax=Paenibacillus polymyxa TaxID=1406 RepID=UPI001BE9F226|nr:hypothetical protein [Paenibacillus polymyxa]MBT2285841.1 hypothetical protein [Paenibacillus polymyxa]